MGYVTVLVQHAWALQPSNSRIGTPQRQQRDSRRTSDFTDDSAGGVFKKSSKSHVRLGPEDVALFISKYNAVRTTSKQYLRELEADDILARLQSVAYHSSEIKMSGSRLSSASTLTEKLIASPKMVKHPQRSKSEKDSRPCSASIGHLSLEARLSLIAFSKCQSVPLRTRAYEALVAALDTNEFANGELEVISLQRLIDETAVALRSALEAGTVNWEVERLLMITWLAVQRLECAYEVHPFAPASEATFRQYLEDLLPSIQCNDPFIRHLLSETTDTIRWLLYQKPENESVFANIALSVLAQPTRHDGFDKIIEELSAVLQDLSTRGERRLGLKFINLLAAAALIKEDACRIFIAVLLRLQGQIDCALLYSATLRMGAIALNARSSNIAKLVVEEGLLKFVNWDNGKKDDDADGILKGADQVQSGAVLALTEIQRQGNSPTLALLAREALIARTKAKAFESPGSTSQPRLSPIHHPRRITTLFNTTSKTTIERHEELHSRIQFLRRFLRTTVSRQPKSTDVCAARKPEHPPLQSADLPLSTAPYHRNFASTHHPVSSPSFFRSHATQTVKPPPGTANLRKLFHPTHQFPQLGTKASDYTFHVVLPRIDMRGEKAHMDRAVCLG